MENDTMEKLKQSSWLEKAAWAMDVIRNSFEFRAWKQNFMEQIEKDKLLLPKQTLQ